MDNKLLERNQAIKTVPLQDNEEEILENMTAMSLSTLEIRKPVYKKNEDLLRKALVKQKA
jgi:hypothetical protein